MNDEADVVDFLMDQPNVVPRINPLILSTDRKYLDFTASPGNVPTTQLPLTLWLNQIPFAPIFSRCAFGKFNFIKYVW